LLCSPCCLLSWGGSHSTDWFKPSSLPSKVGRGCWTHQSPMLEGDAGSLGSLGKVGVLQAWMGSSLLGEAECWASCCSLWAEQGGYVTNPSPHLCPPHVAALCRPFWALSL
jgi:hypothetical protein